MHGFELHRDVQRQPVPALARVPRFNGLVGLRRAPPDAQQHAAARHQLRIHVGQARRAAPAARPRSLR